MDIPIHTHTSTQASVHCTILHPTPMFQYKLHIAPILHAVEITYSGRHPVDSMTVSLELWLDGIIVHLYLIALIAWSCSCQGAKWCESCWVVDMTRSTSHDKVLCRMAVIQACKKPHSRDFSRNMTPCTLQQSSDVHKRCSQPVGSMNYWYLFELSDPEACVVFVSMLIQASDIQCTANNPCIYCGTGC